MNFILPTECFLVRYTLPMLLRYQALHLGDTIGCWRMRSEVALPTLNRNFRKLLFRTLSVYYVLSV